MSLNNAFEVKRYDFNSNLFNEFQNLHYAKDLWPIVYILSDGTIKEAYVGETTDTYSRMNSHLKSNAKNKLTAVHLITSEKFNKSATLDIESNLIKYISGDGQYKLINGNIGLANHNYYQKKEVYWDIFKSIWDKLRAEGVSKHSIEYIDNSDLFKYSPYKTLTLEQRSGLLVIINNLLKNDYRNFIVEGGAGTGKTILAIFLFKLLNTNNEDFNFKEFGEDEAEFVKLIKDLKDKYPMPKMALVVPMLSFRNTLKKVFKNIKGLSASMVIGPSQLIRNRFDIVVVDESHRLRRRKNLPSPSMYNIFDSVSKQLGLDSNTCSELDWVIKQSDKSLLFYDEGQSIKPSDTKKEDFDKLKSKKDTLIQKLQSQFRVKGGNAYISFLDKLLNCKHNNMSKEFNSKDYEFVLFDSLQNMIDEIKLRNEENGLSRLIAGFAWEWISNKPNRGNEFDIKINEIELKWNGTANDWINSEGSINEVGCVHTTQGYDLNYAGIIFGNEISYDKEKNEIVIIKENYYDRNGQIGADINDLKSFIINIYKTIMLRGIKGTYIYVCDKNLREYFEKYIAKFKSEKPIVYLPINKVIPFENSIPFYNSFKVAAGNFGDVQNININDYEWIELPSRYKPSKDLFACKVVGESMNKIIPNGSICLFRYYSGGTRNGRICLVEHRDKQEQEFGSAYTVKEYSSKKKIENDQVRNDSISLKPLSYNSEFTNIELTEDESINLNVIAFFESVLK